ncbi:MAG: FHA domain-containing protein [bacterium]
MPEILVKFQDKVVERVVTEKENLTIGRTSDNDIVLDNRGVSRRHAQINFSPEGALLVDNDSLNGTFVNQAKVSEHFLKDTDIVTIGKFDLIFKDGVGGQASQGDLEGTMVLSTKKQRELVNRDQEARQMTSESGGSLLLELRGKDKVRHVLAQDTITVGRGGLVDIPVRGFFTSKLQARLVKEIDSWVLDNVGRAGKTKVNGEVIDRRELKNGDIVEVGKSTFRFIASSK